VLEERQEERQHEPHIDTLLVHGASEARASFGATVAPVYHTSTFDQLSATGYGEFNYSRSANPTRNALERQLAALDGATRALAYPSGVAALDALSLLLAPGDEVLCARDVYGGTYRLFAQAWRSRGIAVRFVDATNPGELAQACTPRTRLIHAEALGNPLLSVCDVRALSGVARRCGALLSIDNTSLTPVNLRPLGLGADIVIHSATKYLGGHSDLTAGTLAVRDKALGERLAFHHNAMGNVLSPAECDKLSRSLPTLAIRLDRQQASALELASRMQSRWASGSAVNSPQSSRVLYPGLASHPGREVHLAQSRGDGAVVSWCTGDVQRSVNIAQALRLFAIRVSFGSVSSSVSMPCFMSHLSVPPELQGFMPPRDLLRFSIGLESVEDLWADLCRAVESVDAGGES
jgi:cystathionine beta-lyase